MDLRSYNLKTNRVASSVCLFFSYILDSKQCYVNPCLHAGTCHEEGFGYNCTCRLGFTGSNCESMCICHSRCDSLKVDPQISSRGTTIRKRTTPVLSLCHFVSQAQLFVEIDTRLVKRFIRSRNHY